MTPRAMARKYRRMNDQATAQLDDARHLACRPGCASCCTEAVAVTAAEALDIAAAVSQDLSPQALERLRSTVAENVAKLAAVAKFGGRVGNPCALLSEGKCSVYALRPLTCRKYTSTSRNACEARAANGGQTDIIASVARSNMAVIAFKAQQKDMSACGKDTRVYELGAALAEALASPGDTQRQWDAGRTVFSDAAVYPYQD